MIDPELREGVRRAFAADLEPASPEFETRALAPQAEIGGRQRTISVAAVVAAVLVVAAIAAPLLAGRWRSHPASAEAPPRALVYVNQGYGVGGAGIDVRDGRTGALVRRLPYGVLAPDHKGLYVVSGNRLVMVDPATGQHRASALLPSVAWTAGEPPGPPPPDSFSPDGRWLVLSASTNLSQSGSSHFLVFDTAALSTPPRAVDLPTWAMLAAISNDGEHLWLTEYVTAGAERTARLRIYDMSRQQMEPQIVVDNAGYWTAITLDPVRDRLYGISQDVSSPDSQISPTAIIDQVELGLGRASRLVIRSVRTSDEGLQLEWGIALSADGRTLYAINGPVGVVAAVDVERRQISRWAQLPSGATPPPASIFDLLPRLVVDAWAKQILYGGAALSPDGRWLVAPSAHGVVAVQVPSLRQVGTYLPGLTVTSVAFDPRTDWVYAVGSDQARMASVNVADGVTSAPVTAGRGPFGITWVSPLP